MKKALFGALALCAGAAAQAQVTGFVGMGLTGGGDTLAHVTFTNGETHDIKSGGLVDFRGGIEYRQKGAPFAVQASIGYHFDRVNADNGSVRFERIPLEVLGYWYANPNFRIGGGLRYAASAKLRSSGAANNIPDASPSASAGLVLEGEYLFSDRFGLTLRAVTEKYKFDNGYEADGNHFGARFNFYF